MVPSNTSNEPCAGGGASASAHSNLAGALVHRGRIRESERHYAKALELDPEHVQAAFGIIVARTKLGDIEGALRAADSVLARRPGLSEVSVNRSYALLSAARVEEAATQLSHDVDRDPSNRRLRSALAFLSNYLPWTPEHGTEIHRSYGRLVGTLADPAPVPEPEGATLFSVGLLSSDLKSHSVGYFVMPLVANRPAWARLTCISTGAARPGDPIASRLRSGCDEWIDAASMDDVVLDGAIRALRLHALVELNGHSFGNRLSALDRRPTPVIATAIGYPNTTGHPAVRWRIVDSITDPLGAERLCTEGVLRIDPCFLCYEPPEGAPDPQMPPAGNPLTFGSFNHAAKIQEDTAVAWGQLMAGLPEARLLLKSETLGAAAARETILSRLERHGIDRDRVEVIAYTETVEEHLQLYSRMHVALDTMPYNGTTTTCEALWMGVPVVTTAGSRHASRVSASLLRAIGCEELVASDRASFCSIATRLAADRQALAGYRTGLRARMRTSALMDGCGYAERFFAALRHAWDVQRGQARTAGPKP